MTSLRLIAALADRGDRGRAAQALAEHMSAVALFGFVLDKVDEPATGRFVPAPGFRATLPGGKGWRELLARALTPGIHAGTVRYPSGDAVMPAVAWSSPGLALVFLIDREGGLDPAKLESLAVTAPLLEALLWAEHQEFIAAGKLRVASETANQASALAAALDRARSDLQRTVRFNELFAAILGHDLRNPLGAILTAAHLALRRTTDENTIKPLKRILSSGERMTRMTEQLLDFTRARIAGGITLNRRDADLEVLVRHMLDEEEMANPAWTFEQRYIGNVHGRWDSDRLAQVFSNLFSNAVQHGSPDEPLRVRVDGSAGDRVDIDICNKGAVPEELIPILFDPFRGTQHRAHGSRGLGLGLFITQQIVEAHGGTIAVTSTTAHGTTFSIRLPRNQAGVSTIAMANPS